MIFMVLMMVVIGAVTRLTDSGLSIVEWLPISGALPPLNQQQWQEYFAIYQQSPQFIYRNNHFNLADFQQIFWWEFIHRLWGRLIGLVFILGVVGHYIWGYFPKKHYKLIFILGILGLLQGVIGWWMVKSGLINRTEVSQYRLLVHLMMAVIILGLLWFALWNYWGYGWRGNNMIMLVLAGILIASGALVAGLRAGFIHQNFPLMGEEFIPADYFMVDNFWQNWGENPSAAQFNHRILAYILAIWGFIYGVRQRTTIGWVMMGLIMLQICLGVAILFSNMQIAIATAHQINAMMLFLAIITSNLAKK